VQEYAAMSHATLNLIALACGAVGMFGLGMKASDKFWRGTFFVVAALNTLLIASHIVF
jgi:hypothetical protein